MHALQVSVRGGGIAASDAYTRLSPRDVKVVGSPDRFPGRDQLSSP
ncbi:MAG: hypothetical protein KF694_15700 [Mesorhizobium sp.]|nr:hypothetical protein [Mesorhizobium sp.]